MLNNNIIYIIVLLLTIVKINSQSIQDLQKMRSEYNSIRNNRNNPQSSVDIQNNPNLGLPQEAYITSYRLPNDIDTTVYKSKHYGYDFFTDRDTVAFWDNLPTPSNYLLGPGDELIVSLWGETQLRKSYRISRDGKIYDDKVGILLLMGKTIKESKKYLIDEFSQIYETLKEPKPTTYLDLSIGSLQSINVNFVGEVNYPGIYSVHPFSTLITGLIQAGGVDTTGTLRNIVIKRDGRELVKVDLYNYLLKGDIPNNLQLRDQDIVVVPSRKSSITVDSAVARPGIYESIPSETIDQMIDYAGGLKHNASSTISLKRIIPLEKRKLGGPTSESYYIDYKNSKLTLSQNGDVILVYPIFETLNQVEIIGQVKNPGYYNYFDGMTLLDLIELGSGFSDTTFWKSVYQYQGELVRRNPETRYESVINVNLQKLLDGDEASNLNLQNLDRFVVHANLNFFEKKNLTIMGEVNIPGSYPLITDNETLDELISRAGGLTTKALNNGIAIYRDQKYFTLDDSNNSLNNEINSFDINSASLNNINDLGKVRVAWKDEKIILMPGDSIVVKESTRTVNVNGAVYNPGLIEFRAGKRVKFYLDSAGGLNERANKKGIIVIYANGSIRPKKWYSFNLKIQDGATIIVNEKENANPFNLTQFATNWTSIITSMITAIILSKQLGSSS